MRQLSRLKFSQLRAANKARLPLFRNSKGGLAHSKADGSDWTPSQWLMALFGELGELCRVRQQFEDGEISYEEMCREMAKEAADVQIYLDLGCTRLLDHTKQVALMTSDPEAQMLRIVADLGEFANVRKKHLRGDYTDDDFRERRGNLLTFAAGRIARLQALTPPSIAGQRVTEAHPEGVDLGRATLEKFNEVSCRVGAEVFLREETDELAT